MLARPGVVVVGASAGGVEALRHLVAGLPDDLAAPVLVVLHLPSRAPSALPAILSRAGPLPAVRATDGEALRPARIYVAPSDHHLLVHDGHVRLSNGPVENGHRPAVDPLFRSAARVYGPGTVGVVLSGALDDGTAGLAAVMQSGGTVVVQDPADALQPSMPRSAIEHVRVDHVLPAADLGHLIARLVGTGAGLGTRADAGTWADPAGAAATDELPAGLACPYCHGPLFELDGAPAPRYRCRVGHAWSPQSLLDEQSEAFEGAMWMALRALEANVALSRRMAASARKRGSDRSAQRYGLLGVEAENASMVIRDFLRRTGLTADGVRAPAASDLE